MAALPLAKQRRVLTPKEMAKMDRRRKADEKLQEWNQERNVLGPKTLEEAARWVTDERLSEVEMVEVVRGSHVRKLYEELCEDARDSGRYCEHEQDKLFERYRNGRLFTLRINCRDEDNLNKFRLHPIGLHNFDHVTIMDRSLYLPCYVAFCTKFQVQDGDPREAGIDDIWVAPRARARGYANRMLELLPEKIDRPFLVNRLPSRLGGDWLGGAGRMIAGSRITSLTTFDMDQIGENGYVRRRSELYRLSKKLQELCNEEFGSGHIVLPGFNNGPRIEGPVVRCDLYGWECVWREEHPALLQEVESLDEEGFETWKHDEEVVYDWLNLDHDDETYTYENSRPSFEVKFLGPERSAVSCFTMAALVHRALVSAGWKEPARGDAAIEDALRETGTGFRRRGRAKLWRAVRAIAFVRYVEHLSLHPSKPHVLRDYEELQEELVRD